MACFLKSNYRTLCAIIGSLEKTVVLQGISHFGIGVSDLERSVDFYHRVLGLPIVHRMEYNEIPHILRHPQRPFRRAVYFKTGSAPDASVIVMGTIDVEDSHRALLLDELGVHHFAFWVDDIHGLHERLVAEGVEILLKPLDVDVYHVDQTDVAIGPGPCATMFFRDPDGILLQADQHLPRK
jgi:catechol 2,3-dioxygenase-like lactoylglutathione lyase family enzyme